MSHISQEEQRLRALCAEAAELLAQLHREHHDDGEGCFDVFEGDSPCGVCPVEAMVERLRLAGAERGSLVLLQSGGEA